MSHTTTSANERVTPTSDGGFRSLKFCINPAAVVLIGAGMTLATICAAVVL